MSTLAYAEAFFWLAALIFTVLSVILGRLCSILVKTISTIRWDARSIENVVGELRAAAEDVRLTTDSAQAIRRLRQEIEMWEYRRRQSS